MTDTEAVFINALTDYTRDDTGYRKGDVSRGRLDAAAHALAAALNAAIDARTTTLNAPLDRNAREILRRLRDAVLFADDETFGAKRAVFGVILSELVVRAHDPAALIKWLGAELRRAGLDAPVPNLFE